MRPLSHLTATEVGTLLRQGAGAVVSAGQFEAGELATMARQLTGHAVLHVTSSSALNANEMYMIARQASAPAYVSFSARSDP